MEQKRCISSLTLEQLSAELKALGPVSYTHLTLPTNDSV